MNAPYVPPDRNQIAAAFAAAEDYDRHAHIQRIVAERLAERIAALPLPDAPRVLEIGCGTGFLTEALIARGIGGEWLVSDLSAEMVGRCLARVGEAPGRRFAVLDGEYGDVAARGPFDLICSSLAMQWFDDQGAALARLLEALAPGGHCLFTTLGSGSFVQWRTAHEAEGLDPGTPRFASAEELTAMSPEARAVAHTIETLEEHHDSALDFMRALKAIGAHTAQRRHRPLAPAELRRVMQRFEAGGATVSYEVVTCHYAAK